MSIFDRKRVDLNVGFLNRVGVRREVHDALPNGAGDVESIHDPHIRNCALTVDTNVEGRFRRKVVHAGSRCAPTSVAKPRDTRSQTHEREQVAPCQR